MTIVDSVYEAICMHSWDPGKRACSCGWTKSAGKGHKHHLSELAVKAFSEALDWAVLRCPCGHFGDLHGIAGCSECDCAGLPSFAFRLALPVVREVTA